MSNQQNGWVSLLLMGKRKKKRTKKEKMNEYKSEWMCDLFKEPNEWMAEWTNGKWIDEQMNE